MNRMLLIVAFCLLLPMPIQFTGAQQVPDTDTETRSAGPTLAVPPAELVQTPAGAGKSVLQVEANLPVQTVAPAAGQPLVGGPVMTGAVPHVPPGQAPLTRQQELDQINAIEANRDRIGGGVAPRLRGVFDEGDMKRSFRKSLQKLTAQQNQAQSPSTPVAHEVPRSSHGGVGQWHATGPDQALSRRPLRNFTSGTALADPSDPSAAYRSAARHLEQAAAEFEFAGNFGEADRLRTNAAEYWKAARSKN